jgi:CHAD domain-containing protein/HD superfamily phosphodiesterase
MLQVLEECENVAADFNPDSVHDLRVALRRCRSLADGLMALDPDPDWKNMKKAGKRLFQSLGELRDVQVMEEWVEKLQKTRAREASSPALRSASEEPAASGDTTTPPGDSEDAAAQSLLEILKTREQEQKRAAQAALDEFDRKQWRRWSKSLPACAARMRPGSPLFKHLALERWTEARQLHTRALRNRSQTTFHTLRIGIKRFRYIVENFLPAEHKAWSDDLKEMQDVLGEVHDLDVVWTTAIACHVFPDDRSRRSWHELILSQRSKRIDRYRAKMVGENSLWEVWRAALPQGKQVHDLATRRMKLWAHGLDPDFPHSERVASLALQLYDGLLAIAWQPAIDASSARSSLLAAALLHDVGKVKGNKNHHKKSLKLIQSHGNPLGWKPAEFQRAAIIARFHRGALPTARHKQLRDLLHAEQKATIQLAAILRLANALDAAHDGHVRRIQIENIQVKAESNRQKRTGGFLRKLPGLDRNEPLVIAAEGYAPLGSAARAIAAERYLLETVLHRPVLVRPMIPRGRAASR